MTRLILLLSISLALVSCGPSVILQHANSNAEIERELSRLNIVLADGIEKSAAWTALKQQSDRYDENRGLRVECENMSQSRAEENDACACRIIPACSMCDGGPYRCSISDDRGQELHLELKRRECADRGGQWMVYQVSGGTAYALQ